VICFSRAWALSKKEKEEPAVIANPPLAGEAIHLLHVDCFVVPPMAGLLAMTDSKNKGQNQVLSLQKNKRRFYV